jgi:hypothetical protein
MGINLKSNAVDIEAVGGSGQMVVDKKGLFDFIHFVWGFGV